MLPEVSDFDYAATPSDCATTVSSSTVSRIAVGSNRGSALDKRRARNPDSSAPASDPWEMF